MRFQDVLGKNLPRCAETTDSAFLRPRCNLALAAERGICKLAVTRGCVFNHIGGRGVRSGATGDAV